jgi:hypothetical protein
MDVRWFSLLAIRHAAMRHAWARLFAGRRRLERGGGRPVNLE